jgi:hypothetical protein
MLPSKIFDPARDTPGFVDLDALRAALLPPRPCVPHEWLRAFFPPREGLPAPVIGGDGHPGRK